MTADPDRRSPRDAPPFGSCDRASGKLEGRPRLHFDEHEEVAATSHHVDFTPADLEAPRKDPVSLDREPQDRDPFGAKACDEGAPPTNGAGVECHRLSRRAARGGVPPRVRQPAHRRCGVAAPSPQRPPRLHP